MEWSDTSGGSEPWTFQWVCLTCSRTFNVDDVPPMPEATCPGCQQNAGAVVDVTTGNVRRVCTSCNRVVTVPDAVEERRDWFSSCEGGGDVVGVLTPLVSGVAQAFHDDRVVELRVQLGVEDVEGKDREEQVDVERET